MGMEEFYRRVGWESGTSPLKPTSKGESLTLRWKRCSTQIRSPKIRSSKSDRPSNVLAGGFIVAGGAAGFAIHQAVVADADVDGRLAEAAEFVALATGFGHLALGAFEFGGAGSSGHIHNVASG
jgi:hypothetical protein